MLIPSPPSPTTAMSDTQMAVVFLIVIVVAIIVGLLGRRWARRSERHRDLMLAFVWGFIVTAVFTRYIGPWLMWLTMHAVHRLVP